MSEQQGVGEGKLVKVMTALLFVLALVWLVFMHGGHEVWGLNLFHYLPPGIGITLVGLAVASILLSLRAKSAPKGKAKKQPQKTSASKSNWVIPVVIAIGLGLLFLEVQVAWPFLGDGTTYMGMLYNFHESGTMTVQRTSAPVMYLLYGVYDVYLGISNDQGDSFFPFTFVSLVSGLIFVLTAVRFAQVSSRERWMKIVTFFLLMSLGGTLFFFTYVEVYPLQYALTFVYAYLAYRYFRREAKLATVGIVLALCVIAHLQNALLIPSFIFLFSFRRSEDRESIDKRRSVRKAIIFAVPALLVFYILSQTILLDLFTDAVGSPFIPFASTGDSQYTLLSGQHLFDLLNYHFLIAAVPILVIVGCQVAAKSSINWAHPFLLFTLLNIFFLEAFLFGGGFAFGLARDWDVVASLGIFLALLAIEHLRQVSVQSPSVSRLALPLTMLSLTSAIVWIVINARGASAADRYEDLISIYTPVVEKKITSRGYENLRKYQQSTTSEDQLTTIRKMLELYPTPADARQGMVVLSNQYGLSKEGTEEVFGILDILEAQPDSILRKEEFDKVRLGPRASEQATTLGDFFSEFIIFMHKPAGVVRLEDAINRCVKFANAHPQLPYGHETLGYLVATYSQDLNTAIPALQKAIRLDSLRSRPYFYLGAALSRSTRREESIAAFRKGLQIDSEAMWGLSEYTKYLTSSAAVPEEKQYLVELRQFLLRALARPPKSALHKQQHEADKALLNGLLKNVEILLSELS